MSKITFSPAEKKLVSNATSLCFMVSFDGTTSVYQYDIFQQNITNALRTKATQLGISTNRWTINGLGATGGELILQAIIDFYHNYEAWFIILKTIGLIPTLKMITEKLLSGFYSIRSYITSPFQARTEDTLQLIVSVRADVDTDAHTEDNAHGHFYEVKTAMYDLLLLCPVFEEEVRSIVGNMPVRFSLTSKSINQGSAIAVENYLPSSPIIKKRTLRFVKKATYERSAYRISFYRTRLFNILKTAKYMNITVF